MVVLFIGLMIFFTVHFLRELNVREPLVATLGEPAYKGIYSLISIAGFALIIYGKAYSDFIAIWTPPIWARHITMLLTLIALLLIVISQLPNNLKRYFKHPMLMGVALWGGAHLLVNGDLASIILFGGFLIFSVTKIMTMEKHKPYIQPGPVTMRWDIMSIIVGCLVYGGAVFYHQSIAGVPLF